jgi:hypothetical protein
MADVFEPVRDGRGRDLCFLWAFVPERDLLETDDETSDRESEGSGASCSPKRARPRGDMASVEM